MENLHPGDALHGFRIESVSDLPEFRGKGIRARHEATGLDLFHLYNDDRENLFSFTFKTPPRDNSGVAHIVEHAVLAGSRKFPIKDPFLVLLKGSLNTFLNAMTYPDKTVYPGASTVAADYYNLMSVYGDAVFFPLLRKEIFHQEGVRLEPGENGLEVSGVVFNEMQGNYSSFESIVGEWSYRGLFPDSSYGFDSGGEPASIRELTYEDFRAYHEEFYHPSNCRIFLYGNIPTGEQLQFIQENFLSGFTEPRQVDARISEESDWDAPRNLTVDAPGGESEEGEQGSSILISWRLGTINDPVYLLAWEVLAEILLGHPGSPLYKALIDCQMGEDISPSSGLDSELRDLVFAAGLRGIEAGKRERLEETIFGLLQSLVSEGISSEFQEAALARIDFRHREIRGGAPFGLRLMGRALRGWLHDEAPENTMCYENVIEELKHRLEADPDLFSRMLQVELIDNLNHIVVTVRPEEQYHQHNQEDEREWLKHTEANIGIAGIEALAEDLTSMKKFQDTSDSPEDLAAVPCVSMDDLPREVQKLSLDRLSLAESDLYTHGTFCNGVVYLDIAIDLGGLEREELLLLPYFSKYITNTGYPGVSYDRVATLLSRHSGGFYSFMEASDRVENPDEPAMYLYFRIKALEDEFERTLEIVSNLLTRGIMDDQQRLKEELFEMRNDMRSSLVSSGHSYASLRASRGFSPVLALEEDWRGVEQFLYLNSMSTGFDSVWENLSQRMTSLKNRLMAQNRMQFVLTADEGAESRVLPLIDAFRERFNRGEAPGKTVLAGSPVKSEYEALLIPSTVNFGAVCFPAARLGDKLHAEEVLVSHILKVEALWEKIRMQGGAYGAFASVNATEGIFTMASYRDPNTFKTFQAFQESLDQLTEGVDAGLLEKSIISVVGRELKPLSPGEKGLLAFRRMVYGIPDDLRQEKRNQLLTATPGTVQEAAVSLQKKMKQGARVLFSSPEKLEEACTVFPGFRDNSLRLPV